MHVQEKTVFVFFLHVYLTKRQMSAHAKRDAETRLVKAELIRMKHDSFVCHVTHSCVT